MDWGKKKLGKPVSGQGQEDEQQMELPVCLCQDPVDRQGE